MIKYLDPKKQAQPLWLIKERTSETCKHSQIEVDVQEMEISCCACGKVLNPFTVVLEMAYKERRVTGDIQGMQKRVRELKAEEERLRKRIQNLNYKLIESQKQADKLA